MANGRASAGVADGWRSGRSLAGAADGLRTGWTLTRVADGSGTGLMSAQDKQAVSSLGCRLVASSPGCRLKVSRPVACMLMVSMLQVS